MWLCHVNRYVPRVMVFFDTAPWANDFIFGSLWAHEVILVRHIIIIVIISTWWTMRKKIASGHIVERQFGSRQPKANNGNVFTELFIYFYWRQLTDQLYRKLINMRQQYCVVVVKFILLGGRIDCVLVYICMGRSQKCWWLLKKKFQFLGTINLNRKVLMAKLWVRWADQKNACSRIYMNKNIYFRCCSNWMINIFLLLHYYFLNNYMVCANRVLALLCAYYIFLSHASDDKLAEQT